MSGQDIIVVGASAGGVEALSTLVGDLPEDLPAAVFIVLHMGPQSATVLPAILSRRTKLSVEHPRDGERIRRNSVYVAAPDHHLLVRRREVGVASGPPENGHRPSVDTLFRSAAAAYGRRVVGVVLSGTGDDGTAGLRAIHAWGGTVVIQDPAEAPFPGMPQSVLSGDSPDYVLPVGAIGDLLSKLARSEVPREGRSDAIPDELEAALWTAYRALEERAALFRRLADRAQGRQAQISAGHFRTQAAEVNRQAELLRALLWDPRNGRG